MTAMCELCMCFAGQMSICLGTGQDWGHLGAGLKPHVDVETPYDGLGMW